MNTIMKKMQISIIGYVVLFFEIFCRNYVRVGDESSVLVVPVHDIGTDGVWETISRRQGCV